MFFFFFVVVEPSKIIWGLGFRVWGFMVWGLGFRVEPSKIIFLV